MADENKIDSAQEPQATPPSPENTSALRDKRKLPEGVVPKQAQGYVMAGLAMLILMAVMFSKNHAKPAAKTADSGPLAVSTDANLRKIHELEQDLSADQRQGQQQQAMGNSAVAPNGTPAAMQPNGTMTPTVPATPMLPPAEPPRDPVADAEKALAFKARFASNLVSADDGAAHPSAELADLGENAPARSSSLPPTPPTQAMNASAPPRRTKSVRRRSTSTPLMASPMSCSRARPSTPCW